MTTTGPDTDRETGSSSEGAPHGGDPGGGGTGGDGTGGAGGAGEAELGERLALRDGVSSATLPGDELWLVCAPKKQCLGTATALRRAILRTLAAGRVTMPELTALAREYDDGSDPSDSTSSDETEPGGDAAGLDAAAFIGQLRVGGWLAVTVTSGGRAVYTVFPRDTWPAPAPAPKAPLRLSRFTMIRRIDDSIVLQSPRATGEIELHHPAALRVLADLSNLDGPGHIGDPDDMAARPEPSTASGLPGAVVERLRADLRRAELVVPDPDREDTDLRLRQWSPHELWFHDQSRSGAVRPWDSGYGGTFWGHAAGFEPVPTQPEPYDSPAIPLRRPNLEYRRNTDPSLTAAMEDRGTVRRHDDEHPLGVDALGELLYRCARVRGTATDHGVTYLRKPYPAGGSVYELEVYPVVRTMRGLDPGMYHYDAFDHAMRLVQPLAHPAVRRLLGSARASSMVGEEPQVLLLITARVGRLMWKYERMPYALMLKHTGVLYQTLYLVGTAMGLAIGGLGGGTREAFNDASGRDPYEECALGEVMLGSPRPGEPMWGDENVPPPRPTPRPDPGPTSESGPASATSSASEGGTE